MLNSWRGLEVSVAVAGQEREAPSSSASRVHTVKSIEPAELVALRKRLGDRLIVVDVRNSPKGMLRTTLPDARVLSVEELEVRWRQLPADSTVVVYCWDQWSTLSARAAHLLTLRGIKACELAGGIKRWRELGMDEAPLASTIERSRYH